MTFGTLRKPTQPFNTLQEHTTTFFSNFESSRMQVFASFCKVSFYLFFRFIVFVFFIFINLFYSGTLRKPSTISELQKHELEMEIWGFVYFFYLVCLHFCFLFVFFFFIYFFYFFFFFFFFFFFIFFLFFYFFFF